MAERLAVRVLPKPRTDTERLDFLIRHSFYNTVAMELQSGRATSVQLDREYIDNAMWRLEYNKANGKYEPETSSPLSVLPHDPKET